MLENKNAMKKVWIVLGIIIVLTIIMVILQAQMLVMLNDLKTMVFGNFGFDYTNPLPPIRPIDTNPLPPIKIF